jgi:hypothetical protein
MPQARSKGVPRNRLNIGTNAPAIPAANIVAKAPIGTSLCADSAAMANNGAPILKRAANVRVGAGVC